MSNDEPVALEPLVVSGDDAEWHQHSEGTWGGRYQVLTPGSRSRPGLGMARNVLKQGQVGCPFHWHLREDEVFHVLRGRGILRYGDAVREISAGDTISCPAGTRIAHQIANPFPEELEYLSMGPHDPHEVCGYPDNGKVLVRGLPGVGFLERADYMEGEPEEPVIFELFADAQGS